MRLTRILTATGLLAAILAIAASTASAATLQPPVIKERFTALPCPKNPSTTVGLEGCAEQQILKRDKQIDTLNAEIFHTFSPSGPGRTNFIAANTAWFGYRNSYCTSESDIEAGGSGAPVIFADCAEQLDLAHITELKAFLGTFTTD